MAPLVPSATPQDQKEHTSQSMQPDQRDDATHQGKGQGVPNGGKTQIPPEESLYDRRVWPGVKAPTGSVYIRNPPK